MRPPRDAARSAILGVCGCMVRPESLAGTSSPAVSAVHQVRQTVRLARTDSCRDAHSSLVGSGAALMAWLGGMATLAGRPGWAGWWLAWLAAWPGWLPGLGWLPG